MLIFKAFTELITLLARNIFWQSTNQGRGWKLKPTLPFTLFVFVINSCLFLAALFQNPVRCFSPPPLVLSSLSLIPFPSPTPNKVKEQETHLYKNLTIPSYSAMFYPTYYLLTPEPKRKTICKITKRKNQMEGCCYCRKKGKAISTQYSSKKQEFSASICVPGFFTEIKTPSIFRSPAF